MKNFGEIQLEAKRVYFDRRSVMKVYNPAT